MIHITYIYIKSIYTMLDKGLRKNIKKMEKLENISEMKWER